MTLEEEMVLANNFPSGSIVMKSGTSKIGKVMKSHIRMTINGPYVVMDVWYFDNGSYNPRETVGIPPSKLTLVEDLTPLERLIFGVTGK